jgi:uncharacterized protein (UPF0332 family)
MDWLELSLEAERAARRLLNEKMWRSSVNRSYYSVYAAATGRLSPKKRREFKKNRGNPSHEQLPGQILNEGEIPLVVRRKVSETLRVLCKARIDADYRPLSSWFGRQQALAFHRMAAKAMEALEVIPK